MTRTSDPPTVPARLSRFGLTLRNLRYFRAANLAVTAGMAVGTAVLTGALLVGDSVRGSLRDLVVRRLGPVDHALVGSHYFSQSLAERLAATGAVATSFQIAPAIVVNGGISRADDNVSTAGVQIGAIGGDWQPVAPGDCVINDVLADALGTENEGGDVLVQLAAVADVPRDATLGRRTIDEQTAQARLRVSRIAAEPGMTSTFDLNGGQRVRRNAWMSLADLQRNLRQPGRVNLLLADAANDSPGSSQQQAAALNEALRRAMTLDDYGLKLMSSAGGEEQVLSSRTTYIHPAIDAAAGRVAARDGIPLRRVSVHLVNNVVKLDARGEASSTIHYAVAAGISSVVDHVLADDEIALNEWAASRLGAAVGDRIRLDYYRRRPDGQLEEVRSDRPAVGMTFRVKQIIPLSGLGADPTLTPEFPGLTDKATIREAPPEMGIREELLTDDDERYWQQHRAAPKVFVSLGAASRLWDQSFGQLTGIRVPAQHAAAFERALLAELDPASIGMEFRPIKADQLVSASGSTDFSMLFVGLSFFLIVSAALMVAMLFRLAVEQRARQFGVFQAVGFAPSKLYGLAWTEGMALAFVGGVIGLACAVAYAWLMMTGLRTWWVDAVGTTALRVYVEPATLVIGFAASLLIAGLAVAWAARGLRRVEPLRLLSGRWDDGEAGTVLQSRAAAALAVGCAIIGLALVVAGATKFLGEQAAFFGGGAMLLVASLSAANWCFRTADRRRVDGGNVSISLAALGRRSATRHPSRSLLTVSLVALASFLLVAVGGMRQGPVPDSADKRSGTGGYRFIVQSDIPLLADLNTPAGRNDVGIRDPNAPIWRKAQFTSLRRWAGQDASCLNLMRPTSPTVLGVPSDMVAQDRFAFADAMQNVDNPWALLEESSDSDIPMIADAETARYILKLSLGETFPIADQSGQIHQLRLVAVLKGSIFQSELLISESHFRKLFPAQSGFGTVLVETDAHQAAEVRRALGEELDSFAVTIDRTADRLAAYQQVANTYLSTFQTLGSLGLLLGTLGLAVVLLRGLFERRAELALLASIGFTPTVRIGLVIGENALLLLAGLAAGTVCASVAALPRVLASGQGIRLTSLATMFAAVLSSGLAILALAAWLGGRHLSPADLRRE